MALIKLQDTPLHEVQVPFQKPYLLKGYCKNMYAINRWTDQNYIRSKFNNVDFDVEVYKSQKDFEMSKASIKTLPFNDYLKTMGDNSGDTQPYKAINYIKKELMADDVKVKTIKRGKIAK